MHEPLPSEARQAKAASFARIVNHLKNGRSRNETTDRTQNCGFDLDVLPFLRGISALRAARNMHSELRQTAKMIRRTGNEFGIRCHGRNRDDRQPRIGVSGSCYRHRDGSFRASAPRLDGPASVRRRSWLPHQLPARRSTPHAARSEGRLRPCSPCEPRTRSCFSICGHGVQLVRTGEGTAWT